MGVEFGGVLGLIDAGTGSKVLWVVIILLLPVLGLLLWLLFGPRT